MTSTVAQVCLYNTDSGTKWNVPLHKMQISAKISGFTILQGKIFNSPRKCHRDIFTPSKFEYYSFYNILTHIWKLRRKKWTGTCNIPCQNTIVFHCEFKRVKQSIKIMFEMSIPAFTQRDTSSVFLQSYVWPCWLSPVAAGRILTARLSSSHQLFTRATLC